MAAEAGLDPVPWNRKLDAEHIGRAGLVRRAPCEGLIGRQPGLELVGFILSELARLRRRRSTAGPEDVAAISLERQLLAQAGDAAASAPR